MARVSDDRARVPRPLPGCDLAKLPLTAVEGFVFSRIDGASSLADLGSLTGLPEEEVRRATAKLADLGAIELPGYTPQAEATHRPPPATSSTPSMKAVAPTLPSLDLSQIPDDAPELRGADDVDLALRKRILITFRTLDETDYYTLLGVTRSADRKAIKAAYYGLAATFHTDRYFGKELGAFKPMMEAIFGRVTQAHDTLSFAQRREEYDLYLASHERTSALEAILEGDELAPPVAPEEPARLEPRTGSSSTMGAIPTPAPGASSPPLSPEQERARREALARRLGGSSRRMPAAGGATLRTPSPAPVHPSVLHRPSPAELMEQARRAQVGRRVAAAKAAMLAGDLVGAAAQYRAALEHTDDPELRAAHETVSKQARASLVGDYVKNARYQESQEQWGLASLSYLKALDGKPGDAALAERAAHALHREGRDLRRAAHLAEEAVRAKPGHAPFHVTLGHIYLDVGLFLRARTELETAARLLPNDARVRELLARARKAAVEHGSR